MFNDAKSFLFDRARHFRSSMTDAEILLWKDLRTKPHGYKFRRQHPFGLYILDFYCHQIKLAIEVDGPIHDLDYIKENDKERQEEIESNNISVIRFSNDEVDASWDQVVNKIEALLEKNSRFQNSTADFGSAAHNKDE